MSDDTPQNPLDFLKDLSFAPGWAKEPPKEQTLEQCSGADERRDDRREGRGPRRPFGDRGPRRDGGGEGRGERPAFRDRPFRGDRGEGRGPRRDGAERPPFRGGRDDEPRGPRREGGERPPRPEGGERPPRGDGDRPGYRNRGRGPNGGFREPRIDISTLPVEVKFLPEQKEMGVVIRKVQGGHRAYPVRELARLFLSHPESCVVRLEVKADRPELFLHQCGRCGFVTTDPAALQAHMLEKHFEEDFEKTEIEGEAPGGVFTCVAKCGISGRLIGPPNHHSFAQRLRDTMHEVAPGMAEDEYRRRLEMVHDEAVIEQWKEESRKRTVYRRKAVPVETPEKAVEPAKAETVPQAESPVETAPVEPETPAAAEVPAEEPLLDRAMAEAVFEHEIVPKCTTGRKRVSCPFAQAQEIRDPNIAPVIREMWQKEQHSPFSLFIALRGAFRAKKFHLFRAIDDRGMEFVIPKAPVALDASHAVPALVAILDYVRDHQGCTRTELFAAMGVPAEGERTPEQDGVFQQFALAVGSGHLIEYHNGVLALPADHPYFRNLPKPKAKPAEAPTAEAAEATQAAEATEAPETTEATEKPVALEETKAAEMPEAAEATEVTEAPETPAAPEETAGEPPSPAPVAD